jgi:uncharacterized protein (UPF0332 family)
MASVTMVARLLDMADLLVRDNPRSSAFRRRAVSTAYYAVFHALAKVCADNLLQPVERASDEYERVYRALNHGTLKEAFKQKDSPLRNRENLRKLGDLIVPLRSERLRADYLPPIKNVFSREQAEELVEQARRAVAEIDLLNDEDRRALATWLLFKSPPQ